MGLGDKVVPQEDKRIALLCPHPKIPSFICDATVSILKVDYQYFVQKIAIQSIKDISGHNLGHRAKRSKDKENAENEESFHGAKLR
jgi:hypothetical protein